MFKIMQKDGSFDDSIKTYDQYEKGSESAAIDGKDFALVGVEFMNGDEAGLPDDGDIIECRAITKEEFGQHEMYVSGWPS